MAENSWRRSWVEYVDFLLANKQRPQEKTNGVLNRWYADSYGRKMLGQLPEDEGPLIDKISNKGEIYQVAVVDPKHDRSRLLSDEDDITRLAEQDENKTWWGEYNGYIDFCQRNNRLPGRAYTIDRKELKWYTDNKEEWLTGKMPPLRVVAFADLIAWSLSFNYLSKEETAKREFEDMCRQMCRRYSVFIDQNRELPTYRTDRELYNWWEKQILKTDPSLLPEDVRTRVFALRDKIKKFDPNKALWESERKEIEKKQNEHRTQAQERKKKIEQKKIDKLKANARLSITASKRTVSQDERWNRMWQAYMDYMEKYKHRPSKHHAEDLKLFHWFKHSKKLLNQGQLQEDRIERFKLLLDDATAYQRVNQHQYVNTELKVTEDSMHLYPYQAEMKERIEQAFLEYASVMVQMPTGTGKTHVIASVVRDFERDKMGEVWVVAHRRELVLQIKNTLAKYLTKSEMLHIQAVSIQWLSKHYHEMTSEPSLIVIDEAHHAVAMTYAAVMEAYPLAKKLGVTATPYRLSGDGFRTLFQTLLTSKGIKTFIKEGYLSDFDYYSIDRQSEEKYKVNELKKRGLDGDYQNKELDEKFNQEEIISRLFASYNRYAKGKKGFVYAISIAHAENIATYYRQHGVNAVAISSKTDENERARLIEAFKNGEVSIICSVDLFSEGFDAPDADFIQLARPTLSLSKYLQMVGRGLRTAKGKKSCIILDNVGLIDRFGLPSKERDWEAYFNGGWKTGQRQDNDNEPETFIERVLGKRYIGPDNVNEMNLYSSHEVDKAQQIIIDRYRVVTQKNGALGIENKQTHEKVFDCVYDHIAINENGIVVLQKNGETKWYDLLNGCIYPSMPDVGYIGTIPMAYCRQCFYPRLRSRWMNEQQYITKEIMLRQFGSGLEWNGRYIPWSLNPKIYRIIEQKPYGARLLEDDERQYVQDNPGSKVVVLGHVPDLDAWFMNRQRDYDEFARKAKAYPVEYCETDVDKLQADPANKRVWKDGNGIITVTPKDGKQYWIDSMNGRKIFSRPTMCRKRGKASLLYVGDFAFIRNDKTRTMPLHDWQISSDDNKGIYIKE